MSVTSPTPFRDELSQALAGIADLATVSPEEIGSLVADVLVTTYRRHVVDDEAVSARVDLDHGVFELWTRDADDTEASLGPPSPEIARRAARGLRAAVAARLRETAKDRVIEEALRRRGELLDATVEGSQGRSLMLRAGDTWAILPPEEQVPGEQPRQHQHLKVIVIDGRRRSEDAVLVVSRSHPQLLRLLMAQEVPELQSGQVVIRAIAREAGRRSKVAVSAPDGDIDPQGACIGPKGVRHRAVVSELGPEQLQVLTWSTDPAEYVARALSPATVQSVVLDPETRTARVAVATDQLSLAIGRGGENARLAARLTGWRIDIHGEE